MRWALTILCLLGTGGLWVWAMLAPKEARIEPLPPQLAGRYVLVAYEPPPGQPNLDSPLPPGEAYVFTFREDGTYAISVLMSGGYEILRRQGVAAVDASRNLTLQPVSTNLSPEEGPLERYRADWGLDKDGPFVVLRDAELGFAYHLRPAPPEPPR